MRLHAPWVRRVSILVLYIRRGSASEKGASLVNMVLPICDVAESDYADVCRTNPAVCRSSPLHAKRSKFFKIIRNGADFDTTVDSLLKRPLLRRVGSFAKRVVRKVVGK